MTLYEFIADGHNAPFAGALALMLLIAVFEGAAMLVGMGLSNLVDSMLPDIDLDAEVPDTPASALSRFLGWLHIGRVPFLVLMVLFLTAFGLIGYGLQSLMLGLGGMLLSPLIVAPVALMGALPVVRLLGGGIGKIMPQDESSAISEEEYIGLLATITLGHARRGYPAEARLKDRYGQVHYIMVEPEGVDEEFVQGDEILLVGRASSRFTAIKNPHAALSDHASI